MSEQRLFPREVTGNLPQVTLTGRELLHLEQHRGITVYQPERMVFRTAAGLLEINGKALRFRSYSAAEAVITGEINQITMTTGGSA